jgi:hypothetical protein
MSAVYYTCPTLKCEVDSGIDVDEATFVYARLTITRVVCARCGKPHRFLLADTTLRDEFSNSKRDQPFNALVA